MNQIHISSVTRQLIKDKSIGLFADNAVPDGVGWIIEVDDLILDYIEDNMMEGEQIDDVLQRLLGVKPN